MGGKANEQRTIITAAAIGQGGGDAKKKKRDKPQKGETRAEGGKNVLVPGRKECV